MLSHEFPRIVSPALTKNTLHPRRNDGILTDDLLIAISWWRIIVFWFFLLKFVLNGRIGISVTIGLDTGLPRGPLMAQIC